MIRSNQIIVQELLDAIVDIVSKGSSKQYILMVLKKFIESNMGVFQFAGSIKIDLNGVRVSGKINSAAPKIIGEFLTALINTLFSELFMHLVSKKLSRSLAEDLEKLGVKICSKKEISMTKN